jgi:hypothetical protein
MKILPSAEQFQFCQNRVRALDIQPTIHRSKDKLLYIDNLVCGEAEEKFAIYYSTNNQVSL